MEHSCLVGANSGPTNKIQISTVAFLARSGLIRSSIVLSRGGGGGVRGDSGSILQGARSSIGALHVQCNHKPKKYPEYADLSG